MTKFSVVLHPTGCFRYILGFRGNNAFVRHRPHMAMTHCVKLISTAHAWGRHRQHYDFLPRTRLSMCKLYPLLRAGNLVNTANEKIRNQAIRTRIGRQRNIAQRVMERKLTFFGHICRMDDDRLVKRVLFGMLRGRNRRGRPRRKWSDDIIQWCNKDIHSLAGLAVDRAGWRILVKRAVDTNGRWSHGV